MRLVEMADEFDLTTAEAIDLCLAAGIEADSSETILTGDQQKRWRHLAEEQRTWQATARQEAADAAEVARVEADARLAAARTSFGPIPAAPWEQARSADDPPVAAAPMSSIFQPELGAGWAPTAGGGPGAPQVSLYAAVALGLAVVSLIFPFLPAMLALPFAWHAKSKIDESRGVLTGERLAAAAQVLSAIGIVLWLGIFSVALYNDGRSRSSLSTPMDLQIDTREVAWDEMEPGMCVRIPHADLTVRKWQTVDCNAPHEAEVFAMDKILRDGNDPYPGRGQIIPGAQVTCENAFATYVGKPFRSSEINMGLFFPTVTNWTDETDRSIGCIAYLDHYDMINGSLKNATR